MDFIQAVSHCFHNYVSGAGRAARSEYWYFALFSVISSIGAAIIDAARQSGAQAITLDYSMEKTPAGWKVFDVEVGGVSLVANYRETFTNEIRNAGIDGLIKTLSSKNKQLEAKT